MNPRMPEHDLSGEIAVLTGGAGILGARFARALAVRGARVALVDVDVAKAGSVADEINSDLEGRVSSYGADISEHDSMIELHARIESEIGDATILINNAAAKSENFFAPFESFPLEDWEQVLRVNTTGVMLGCQVIGGSMARRGKGSIINLLSIYGIVAPDQRIYEGSQYEGRAINTPAVYSASKAAVWGLTRYLATYWADKGVRVNAITPGGVFSGQNDTFVWRYSARVPMGRMADRDELCGAVVFLSSSASSYMTGQNLVVDGGLTVW